jgi:hypothetical protein
MANSLAVFLYKIVSLLVGLAFAYMGYRLFMSSVWGQAGELDAQFGKNKILLKKAAPGTFFALFGAVVVALTIWKGLTFETTTQSNPLSSQQSYRINEAPEPDVFEEAPEPDVFDKEE